jgi:hypothetical protein
MYSRYRAYYFKELPIARLQRLDFSHMHYDGVRTGGMPPEEFISLKDDIRKNGLLNPVIVEVDSGNPPRFRIAMGNNRVEAWDQLDHDTIKALVICKQQPPPIGNLGEYEFVDHPDLESFMAEAHPGDELWKKSSWADRMLRAIA